jgi:hypothetical protein
LTITEQRTPPTPAVHARRVIFIDLGRALAVVFMLYGHTGTALLAPAYQAGWWFDAWQFQRGLTSSLFLLLGGFAFSIATSRHWASHVHLSGALARRLRRFGLFILLGYALHFPVTSVFDLPGVTEARWRSFVLVDVLQLVGLALAVTQLLVLLSQRRHVFTIVCAALAGAIVVATPYVWSTDWTGTFPVAAAAYLSFGSGPGAIVPSQVLVRVGTCLLLLAGIAHVSRRMTSLPHVFGAVAQESLLIYFVHLCIVYGSVWNPGLVRLHGASLGPAATLFWVVAVIASMAALAWYWNWWKHARPRAARWISVATLGALFLWLL